jgi:hypothetical protein
MRTCEWLLLVVLSCALVLGSGCATIITGSTQSVGVTSEPIGAKVTADGVNSITTPGTMVLKRNQPHTLVAEFPGYPAQQQRLDKKLNNWVFGNILLGGIIGLVIDFVSGSADELSPKEVHFNLKTPSGAGASAAPLPAQGVLVERRDELQRLRLCTDAT